MATAGDRDAKLAALHQRLTDQVRALRSGSDWTAWLSVASRFHTYSVNNTLLIMAQRPDATAVAGYRGWQALGRQVDKGEKGLQILAPILRTVEQADPDGGEPERSVRVSGYRVTHVWDLSQTSGRPLPERPQPKLLRGQAPEGLWDSLATLVTEREFTLRRGDCGGANGITHFGSRTVQVRTDVDDAQAVKTLAHDLLTAPRSGSSGSSVRARPCDAPSCRRLHRVRFARCCRAVFRPRRAGVVEMDQTQAPRNVSTLLVPSVGRVSEVAGVPGFAVLDATGAPVPQIREYLCSVLACGASSGSVRSYAMALLRWWRFLAAIDVACDRVARVDVRDFVLWMRFVPRTPAGPSSTRPGAGYAPATINHNLAVLKGFYADRLEAGVGPVVNPVPDAEHRAGRRAAAHHNPMRPQARGPRAPLRQRLPARVPRSLPDHLFDALFAVMGCDRDRALLAFYVSTGARAAELLGVTMDLVDPGTQRIGVHRKGSGRLQWLPASTDAFVWLRLYQQHQVRPAGQRALWLTRRSPHQPLTYSATRRMLQRANAVLGTAWTLHDLRHTATQRMIDDPRLSLTDVQWVLGHANLTTTQIYVRPREDEVIARVLDHQRNRREQRALPPRTPPVGGYRPEVLTALLGGGDCV